MRAFVELAVLVTADLDQLQKLIGIDNTVDDTSTRASTQSGTTITLAPSASSVQIPFGGVTNASLVVVVANQPIKLQLNSNTAPLVDVVPTPAIEAGLLTLSEFQTADQPGLVLWRGKVTSIFASNPSSTLPASFYVGLVGEAA